MIGRLWADKGECLKSVANVMYHDDVAVLSFFEEAKVGVCGGVRNVW